MKKGDRIEAQELRETSDLGVNMTHKKLPNGFTAVQVQGDTDALADKFERLLIHFPHHWQPGEPVDTRLAPIGILTAGWVIGVRAGAI